MVVVAFDPEECALPDLGQVVPWPGVDEFFLVGREERFGDGIVVTCRPAPHGTDHPVGGTEIGEFFAGVLAAAVAVEDDPGRRPAGSQRSGQRFDDQAGPQVVSDGVADHLA